MKVADLWVWVSGGMFWVVVVDQLIPTKSRDSILEVAVVVFCMAGCDGSGGVL